MAAGRASGADSTVAVAAGVLVRGDGTMLLARRPPGKVYAGYWEFPGGKVEPGETAVDALRRELHEELGVEVRTAYPWITRTFVYPHATVKLHFFRVMAWEGEVHAHEHDATAWSLPDAVTVSPLLPANGPVLKALALPAVYGISQASALGREEFLRRLEVRLKSGLRLVQVREPGWSTKDLVALTAEVVRAARAFGARVLVNADAGVAEKAGADGVHLTAARLGELRARPELPLVGASCHNAGELRLAEKIGADFAVLGPVRPTATHPGHPGLGWERFCEAARGSEIPVYALGGMSERDLEAAWTNGAHGVSMIRACWKA
jgi:8-oxo-dGTP diphosphatase